jgi:alpha/beta superfamily hydrolase
MNGPSFIEGPCGVLEAQLAEATVAAAIPTLSILCHPHPQYGGSMHDSVLDSAVRALTAAGIDALRFNFRGVGQSAGTYADGIGEVDDLVAVADWVQGAYPESRLWLVGYSFGAHVAHRAAAELQPSSVMLIAPATAVMAFDTTSPDEQTHAIAGDQDDFVDAAQLSTWLGERANIIPGADHFFSATRPQLDAALTNWATQTMTAPVINS